MVGMQAQSYSAAQWLPMSVGVVCWCCELLYAAAAAAEDYSNYDRDENFTPSVASCAVSSYW